MERLTLARTAGVACCSNAQRREWAGQNADLARVLSGMGQELRFSPYLYAREGSAGGGTAAERAAFLMDCYRDNAVGAIYDISGGDIANEILPLLDYEAIRRNPKPFWGYSDLTTVLNAIYTQSGVPGVLYQVKNLVFADAAAQRRRFAASLLQGTDELFAFSHEFVQGTRLDGTVVGGNCRCLLKLAGTQYFPDVEGKVLLLESLAGGEAAVTAYLSQLSQLGVFGRAAGVVLGTFTEYEAQNGADSLCSLVRRFVRAETPVAKTAQVGHGPDSRAVVIGGELSLR